MTSSQKSKSLAVMFLLGAFLTGGAFGFVADRAVSKRPVSKEYDDGSMRQAFALELALSDAQRQVVDSIFDWRNGLYQDIRLRIKPSMDSTRDSARVLINQQLDAAQQVRFRAMLDSLAARDSVRRARGETR